MPEIVYELLAAALYGLPLIIFSILEIVTFARLVDSGQKRFSLYPKLITFLLVWLGGGVLLGLCFAIIFGDFIFYYILGATVLPVGTTALLTAFPSNVLTQTQKIVSILCGVFVAIIIIPIAYFTIVCPYFQGC